MIERLPSAESTPSSRDLRVAVIIPNERLIISPGHRSPQLFTDIETPDEPVSDERRAVNIGQRLPLFGLPPMSAIRHLGNIEDTPGYVVRPASGHTINFRLFTVKAHKFDTVLQRAEEDPDFINPTELEFFKRAFAPRR